VREGVEDVNAIDVARLSYRYPDGTPALDDVSFAVAEGERVALIGPNGAGKSTVLLHLNGLLPERLGADGAVRIFGRPVTEPTLATIRAEVAFLFQDPDDQLFCATVFEDVAFGPRQAGVEGDALRARVAAALDAVGLAGFERRPPHRLSRGEKHRVCLAGLLACEPKVLALDEPTSHLDPRGRRELLARLRALPVTQVVATHDLEFVVELCSRAILLDGGRLVAEGPTERLLADEPRMLAHGLERPHILAHRHPHGGA
jgi:cobalt/nickel transport system ATP-binding protein